MRVFKKILILLICLALLVLIITIAYWALFPENSPTWTGFDSYDETTQGPRAKTLWDWLDLLVIPIFLALAAWWLQRAENKRTQELEADRQQQTSLDSYFDFMTELLSNNNLQTADKDRYRSIARTRTIALLRLLDGERKSQVLQFLYESELINEDPIVQLRGADFRSCNLKGASLQNAELRGVYFEYSDLEGSNLSEADLRGSDFSFSNFSNANLDDTNLHQANLSGAIFHNTDLTSADISQTILEYADLSKAKIIKKQTSGLTSSRNTILPGTPRNNRFVILLRKNISRRHFLRNRLSKG